MPISRMQQPRQQYGLGSLVKSITKGVKKIVKSPLGKAAILGGLGMIPFGATGTSLFGRMGAGLFGTGLPLGSPKMGGGVSKGLLGKIGLSGSAGKAALGIGAASTLAGILASDADMTEEEAEQLKQDPVALKNYLTLYYSNLNPRASKEEVDSFVRTNMYADGGRVNYQQGSQPAPAPAQLGSPQGGTSLYGNVLKYLKRQGKDAPQGISPEGIPGAAMPFGGGSFNQSGGSFNQSGGAINTPMSPAVVGPGTGMLQTAPSAPTPTPTSPNNMPPAIKEVDPLLKEYYDSLYANQIDYIKNTLEKEEVPTKKEYFLDQGYIKDASLSLQDPTAYKYKDFEDYSQKTGLEYQLEKMLRESPEKINQTTLDIYNRFKERRGYAMGSPEQNAMQAAGIMNLPLNQNKAGVTELDLRESGGFIPPVGVKEKADDIPAMLSNNEFVFTADAVRGMGDGNVNKGAQRMYDMMKKLEKGGRV